MKTGHTENGSTAARLSAGVVRAVGLMTIGLGLVSLLIWLQAKGPLVHGEVPKHNVALTGFVLCLCGLGAFQKYKSVSVLLSASFALVAIRLWTDTIRQFRAEPWCGEFFIGLFWTLLFLIPAFATAAGWKAMK